MAFMKHVGIHNQRKAIVCFREVPGEEHMCLIAYSDRLPETVHHELMKCVESELGQSTADLADVMHRHTMADGRNLLTVLHTENRMQKVPNNQFILTPNSQTRQRLDEVNQLMRDIAAGNAAAKRAQELDEGRGMQMPAQRGRDLGEPSSVEQMANTLQAPSSGALSDADIAADLNKQASDLEASAQAMLAEAKRLQEEAQGLTGNVTEKSKKRGRPKKQTA